MQPFGMPWLDRDCLKIRKELEVGSKVFEHGILFDFSLLVEPAGNLALDCQLVECGLIRHKHLFIPAHFPALLE